MSTPLVNEFYNGVNHQPKRCARKARKSIVEFFVSPAPRYSKPDLYSGIETIVREG